MFVMLNPSTADAWRDDPTIARCKGFAERWGYARLEVVNLFALRATHPADLKRLARTHDVIGPRNDAVLRRACRRADRVVAAWGAHGDLLGRADEVRAMLPHVPWQCLGTTKDGHPRHPGRIPNATRLVPLGD